MTMTDSKASLCARGVLIGAIALGGCSPRFDWREHAGADGLAATFPGRVQSATRKIELAGVPLEMRMDATRVDDLSFAIGVARLPEGNTTAVGVLVDAVQAGLAANAEAGAAEGAHELVLHLGAHHGPVSARAFTLQKAATPPSAALAVEARVFVVPPYLYQVVVAGPEAVMNEAQTREAVDTFMSSLRLP
jgi:hypothetical protein